MSGRVHRVLVTDLVAGEVVLRGPEAHHLGGVLRVRPGEQVQAFDGEGSVADGTVASVDRQSVTLSLQEPKLATTEAPLRLTVAVALLKSDKLSDVVRQCTELGVARFLLLVTQRADATKLSPARLQRLQRVAEEAARQSGRATVPGVEQPQALRELRWQGAALVAHPGAAVALGEVWPHTSATGRNESPGLPVAGSTELTLITGPEGGFSDAEVAQLEERGARSVRLGPRILRAETAPVALAAALLLPAGE